MKGSKLERLVFYKDAIEGLYNEGYCRGVISKKKIRIIIGIISQKIREEQKILVISKGKEV